MKLRVDRRSFDVDLFDKKYFIFDTWINHSNDRQFALDVKDMSTVGQSKFSAKRSERGG